MDVRSVLCLALIHALVDGFAQILTPLWPQLKQELGLSPWAFTLLFAVWQSSSSVSQPVFGYLGDRFNTRWLVGVGPALAVVCIGLVGSTNNRAVLAGLLAVGGLGIGAFHPEAAVGVVEASGFRKLASALSLFAFGGMVGLGVGPIVSGALAGNYGRQSLVWFVVPGLLFLGALLLCRGRRTAKAPSLLLHHPARSASLAEIFRGRWLPALLLLAVATLRTVPAVGIPLALAFWLDRRGFRESHIGAVQSVFLLSGGLGTLLCPLFLRPGKEVAGLLATILPAGGCMALLTSGHRWVQYAALAGSGLLLQGAIPLLIAYSQGLLPRGRRLAASLILGTSWGLGGLIVAGLQAYFDRLGGRYDRMLWALVPFTALAAVATYWLPRGEPEINSRAVPTPPALRPGTAVIPPATSLVEPAG